MAAFVPVGLSYLLPADGQITISAGDISSASGQIGPLTLKITNTSVDTIASVAYSNPYVPPTAPLSYYYSYDVDGQVARITVEIVPGISAHATIANQFESTPNWSVGQIVSVYGSSIGGTSPENNLTFAVTGIDIVYPGETPVGTITTLVYDGGVVPGVAGPTPGAPTLDNPTQVVVIGANATEYIQIPGSLVAPQFIPLDVSATGADVYVTPIKIL